MYYLKGREFDTKNCGKLLVIEQESNTRFTVKFLTSGYVKTNVHTREIRKGEVGDPYFPKIFNKGYLGVGKYKTKCGKDNSKEYNLWYAMLARCYSGRYDNCYEEVTVANYWHNFQTFCKDIESLDGYENRHIYHFDKDKKVPGSKIYSRDTCSFIPVADNCTTYGNTSKVIYSFTGTKGNYSCTSLRTFAETYSLDRKRLGKLVRGEITSYKGLVYNGYSARD